LPEIHPDNTSKSHLYREHLWASNIICWIILNYAQVAAEIRTLAKSFSNSMTKLGMSANCWNTNVIGGNFDAVVLHDFIRFLNHFHFLFQPFSRNTSMCGMAFRSILWIRHFYVRLSFTLVHQLINGFFCEPSLIDTLKPLLALFCKRRARASLLLPSEWWNNWISNERGS
jgi:hypothetical protein